jgi:hypothetical protein
MLLIYFYKFNVYIIPQIEKAQPDGYICISKSLDTEINVLPKKTPLPAIKFMIMQSKKKIIFPYLSKFFYETLSY